MENYYDILGARPDDDGEKIKSAFREAIKATHPDIHPGDPNASVRLGRIVGAYSVLRDADQRAAYDRQLERIRQRQAATSADGPVPQGAVRAAGKAGRRSSRAKPMHAIFGVKGPTVAIAIAVVGLGTALTGGSLWLRSTWKLPATVEATTSLPTLIAVPAEAESSVRDQTAKVESGTVSGVPSTVTAQASVGEPGRTRLRETDTVRPDAGPLEGGKVALVVGVSNYEHVERLGNTLNDANDTAAALKRLGFDVETLLDPNRFTLEAAARRYGERSVEASVSVFYYSGHALESAGLNWLLPAPARLATWRDLRFEAVELNAIQEQAEGVARVSIVLLDACRENPYSRQLFATRPGYSSPGLARVDVAPSGVLVVFATAPGQLALDNIGDKRNSPFTAALLRHLETPGLEIKSLLARVTKDVVEETKGTQRPWQNSSLVGDFYFSPPPAVADVSSKLANAPQVALPPAPRLFPRPLSSADRDEITGIIERARVLVAIGDIPTARVVLRHAYERGDERAALELGGTYDPLVLRRLNAMIKKYFGDAIQARDWYVRAAELGSVDAIYRMSELDSHDR